MSTFHAGRALPRWGVSLGIVLLTHLLAIGAVLWWRRPAVANPSAMPMQAVMVELAPAPVAAPAPPVDVPPGPQQQEQPRPRALPQPRPPQARQPPPPKQPPPEAPPDVPDPHPSPEPQATQQPQVADTTAPPRVQAPPQVATAAAQTVSSPGNAVIVTWQGVLLGHLEKHRRYPMAARRSRIEGVTYVRFAVDRQGNVLNPRIGRSSGQPSLDEETLATLQRATPVPPPPPEVKGDPVEVMVPVVFSVKRP
jgi:protein TonB